MKTSDIKGIIPPVITPMNNDPEQTVNHQALREQVERLLAGGVHGIFPMGTNGEAYALSFQEKEEILGFAFDVCLQRGKHCCLIELVTEMFCSDELCPSGRQIAELPTAFLDGDAVLLHEPIGKLFKTRCAVQH